MSKELAAMVGDESADEILHQIDKYAGALHVAMPDSIDGCMDRVTFLANRQFTDAAEMGLILMNVKSQVGHGQFSALLEQRGIHRRSATRALAVAKMLLALPKSKMDTVSILNLNQRQLSELARVPIETLKELDDEDFEILAETASKDIRKQVAMLIEQKNEAETALAHAVNELENERLRKAPTVRFDMPVFISELRKDAVVHTELLNEVLEHAQNGIVQLCQLRSIDLNARISAAQVVHHAYASIYMQLGQLLSQVHLEFGDYVQGIDNLPHFDDAEWQYVDTERERLLESFRLNAKSRGAK